MKRYKGKIVRLNLVKYFLTKFLLHFLKKLKIKNLILKDKNVLVS